MRRLSGLAASLERSQRVCHPHLKPRLTRTFAAETSRNLKEISLSEIEELEELDYQKYIIDDDDDKDRYVPPWHVLLEPAARAAWRTSDQSPPEKWITRRQEIIQHAERTTKQLRRVHEKILITQRALIERRNQERKDSKLRSRSRKKGALSSKEEHDKVMAASPVYYKADQAYATLQHRLLPTYAIALRVLQETHALLPNFAPKRLLDFGIGVGSSSAAAMEVFDSLEWIHGIDPSLSMRECAQQLLHEENGPRITTDATLTSKPSGGGGGGNGTFDLILFSYTATELINVAATLAAVATMWEKLSPNGVLIMIEPGTPDGFANVRSVRSMLLDCCPPHKEDDDEEERELYANLDQCHIIAPCTHSGECPMDFLRLKLKPEVLGKDGKAITDNNDDEDGSDDDESDSDSESDSDDDEDNDEDADGMKDHIDEADYKEEQDRLRSLAETNSFESSYCSFVHNIPGSPGGGKGDKLSYLVAQKRYPDVPAQTEGPFPNVSQLLAQTVRSSFDRDRTKHMRLLDDASRVMEQYADAEELDPLGLSLLVGDQNRSSFGRLVRAPLKRRGHILIDSCVAGEDHKGRIVRQSLGKSTSTRIAPGQYTAARKARWGGFWPNIIDKIK